MIFLLILRKRYEATSLKKKKLGAFGANSLLTNTEFAQES
jgi:hypothetical protein